jgi:hypothetical protein
MSSVICVVLSAAVWPGAAWNVRRVHRSGSGSGSGCGMQIQYPPGLKHNFTICPDVRTPGNGHSVAGGLLAVAVASKVVAVQAMVLDESGCSRISCSCHSACEF